MKGTPLRTVLESPSSSLAKITKTSASPLVFSSERVPRSPFPYPLPLVLALPLLPIPLAISLPPPPLARACHRAHRSFGVSTSALGVFPPWFSALLFPYCRRGHFLRWRKPVPACWAGERGVFDRAGDAVVDGEGPGRAALLHTRRTLEAEDGELCGTMPLRTVRLGLVALWTPNSPLADGAP